ncbi:MAG: DUF6362 family protein [Alphaproteobacteria bacterium]
MRTRIAAVAAPPAPTGAWTALKVERRLVEAVDTLRRLPAPRVQRRLTRWPDFVRTAHEAYGYHAVAPGLGAAAPEAIGRMEGALLWLRWLSPTAQRILWSRASGFSWRRIAAFAGKAPNTCRAWYMAGLKHIADRLNASPALRDQIEPSPDRATLRAERRLLW